MNPPRPSPIDRRQLASVGWKQATNRLLQGIGCQLSSSLKGGLAPTRHTGADLFILRLPQVTEITDSKATAVEPGPRLMLISFRTLLRNSRTNLPILDQLQESWVWMD